MVGEMRSAKRRLLLVGVLLVMLGSVLLGGCARGQTEIAPPEIHYGDDVCAACNMIISDSRFAAGYVVELKPGRYDSLAFDDIGDMLTHQSAAAEPEIVAWYVHDYTSEEWLDATTAYFVVSAAIMTPMGHGVAAFATPEAAQEMAGTHDGEVFTWSELLEHTMESAGAMHQH